MVCHGVDFLKRNDVYFHLGYFIKINFETPHNTKKTNM